MCLHFYLVLFEQIGYSMFLVQYRKVFSDQYNFFERVDLAFALLYVYLSISLLYTNQLILKKFVEKISKVSTVSGINHQIDHLDLNIHHPLT